MESNNVTQFTWMRDQQIAVMIEHLTGLMNGNKDGATKFVFASETCRLLCKPETGLWWAPAEEMKYLIEKEFQGDSAAWRQQLAPG